MSRRLVVCGAAALLVATTLSAPLSAIEPVDKSFFGDLALDGYDAVAYFDEGKPVEGRKEHQAEWNGAVWRFATAERRERFLAEPERYSPRYGGYCAWAVSQGYTAGGDPKAWSIVDGALYLNYDQKVKAKWLEDAAGNIARGDENWPKLLTE